MNNPSRVHVGHTAKDLAEGDKKFLHWHGMVDVLPAFSVQEVMAGSAIEHSSSKT